MYIPISVAKSEARARADQNLDRRRSRSFNSIFIHILVVIVLPWTQNSSFASSRRPGYFIQSSLDRVSSSTEPISQDPTTNVRVINNVGYRGQRPVTKTRS